MSENIRTLRTDKGMVVETAMTDAEAAEIISAAKNADDFARKLVWEFKKWGRLFPNKLAWLHRKALDIIEREMMGDEPAPAVEVNNLYTKLFVLFNKASKLKWPTITFEVKGNVLQLVFCRVGKNANTISVSSGRKARGGVWYGRIHADGRFVRSRCTMPTATETLLKDVCDEPEHAVIRYGKKTGRCCFCDSRLTDQVSAHFGYGSTCAGHYGLPHGVKAARATGYVDSVAS